MEWLMPHITRIDNFYNTSQQGRQTYLHIPKTLKRGYDYEDENGYSSNKEKRIRPDYQEQLKRYHELITYKGKTRPVSVIVSDRSNSSSSVPSPTSSVSDVNTDGDNKEHQPDGDIDEYSNDKNESNKNKRYNYKPLPMVRKSERRFISDEKKDQSYWERRKRNNEAAKKSRESRREKEIEVNLKCADLEKENTGMKFTIMNLQERNSQLSKNLEFYRKLLIKHNLLDDEAREDESHS